MEPFSARRLQAGDEIRIIAPARSLALLDPRLVRYAHSVIESLGFTVTYAKHAMKEERHRSGSVEDRIADLHNAFRDRNVRGILTVIGGFNSNQLLDHIDYDLIKNNPKILCGYSDITALGNAITAKTGLITYNGPHFSTFGKQRSNEYTIRLWRRAVMTSEPYTIEASEHWSDDPWWMNQEQENLIKNPGPVTIQEGESQGTLIGGNLCTFMLLNGTHYQPARNNTILAIEEDDGFQDQTPQYIDRHLQSLIHQPGFRGVRGIIFGRFQKSGPFPLEEAQRMIAEKPELAGIPVVYGADFGHTSPMATLPIGGEIRMRAGTTVTLDVLRH